MLAVTRVMPRPHRFTFAFTTDFKYDVVINIVITYERYVFFIITNNNYKRRKFILILLIVVKRNRLF